MSGNLGRTRRASAFVITGNKNGLAGFALAKANMGQTALRKAKNRCAQKLIYVERYNEHTGKQKLYQYQRGEFLNNYQLKFKFCTTFTHNSARRKYLFKRNLKDMDWFATVLYEQYVKSLESRISMLKWKAPQETSKI